MRANFKRYVDQIIMVIALSKQASKRQQARVQNNKKTAVIVGDSIVKGLQQHKLSKAAKQNVGTE